MIFSDLPSPAEASDESANGYQSFAQAGNRFPLSGSCLERRIGLADLAADAGEAFLGGLVLVVDIERLGVGASGLIFLSQSFIGQSAAGPGSQIRGLELHRLIQILGGRFGI